MKQSPTEAIPGQARLEAMPSAFLNRSQTILDTGCQIPCCREKQILSRYRCRYGNKFMPAVPTQFVCQTFVCKNGLSKKESDQGFRVGTKELLNIF